MNIGGQFSVGFRFSVVSNSCNAVMCRMSPCNSVIIFSGCKRQSDHTRSTRVSSLCMGGHAILRGIMTIVN